MALRVPFRSPRNVGLAVLALWLIVTGLSGLMVVPLPPVVMAILALVAGVLILIGK